MNIAASTTASQHGSGLEKARSVDSQPPQYTDSPISPMTFNVTLQHPDRINAYSKPKRTSRTARLASSMRRKSTIKAKDTTKLPADPIFTFSSSGKALLLRGKREAHCVCHDISATDPSTTQGCRYDVEDTEAVAAGDHRCVVVAAGTSSKKNIIVFNGLNITTNSKIELPIVSRSHALCVAVSKDDKWVAISLDDQIDLFSLEEGLKRVLFQHQLDVYEIRGGVSHRRSIPETRTTSDESIAKTEESDSGAWIEAAQEQSRQTAIVSRKLYSSTNSQRFEVATQLGERCVYIDVCDVIREPVSTVSEHLRSFNLPPWVLNDGDLTGVFYDSVRHSALVTAFLGKYYPIQIPFPGFDPLQNENYSTKIISAAQSPLGSTFIIANAMTEIKQFKYTSKGILSLRKLKKHSAG
ncbi:hypothetical protein EK21DRAFT_108925 [Setomelanomma holmii]|uniref:Uncharacterized protein n=1 Tax=Setomelanomma holmii TaxID=210430 RepID=A0A9P4HH30_9PLEO|nr:hypothetical protein EK21DRAFT_108925 [Setomelanomma holmii]